MEKILRGISKSVLLLNEAAFTKEQIQSKWLGYAPASDAAIEAAEKRLNCSLPTDYKEFLKITNGFSQTSNAIHSSFLPVEKIDYLLNLDDDLIEAWEESMPDIGKILRTSILIGGLNESQRVLLIPQKNKWIYWQFAHWIPGERPYKNLKSYFKYVFDFFKDELTKPQPEPIRDFSLRDALFALDWQTVYDKSKDLILNGTDNNMYQYYDGKSELCVLMLLASSRLNCQNDLIVFFKTLPDYSPNPEALKSGQQTESQQVSAKEFMEKLIQAAQAKQAFFEGYQDLKRYKPQENPKTLADIEAQIKKHRKDLLKEKNAASKIWYQLFFLYEYGNTDGFLDFYKKHENEPNFFPEYLKLANFFAYLGDTEKAKMFIGKYIEDYIEARPLEPYLNETLLTILENR
jgi:SMI1 / KNR4 family (SUKH-1)